MPCGVLPLAVFTICLFFVLVPIGFPTVVIMDYPPPVEPHPPVQLGTWVTLNPLVIIYYTWVPPFVVPIKDLYVSLPYTDVSTVTCLLPGTNRPSTTLNQNIWHPISISEATYLTQQQPQGKREGGWNRTETTHPRTTKYPPSTKTETHPHSEHRTRSQAHTGH